MNIQHDYLVENEHFISILPRPRNTLDCFRHKSMFDIVYGRASSLHLRDFSERLLIHADDSLILNILIYDAVVCIKKRTIFCFI